MATKSREEQIVTAFHRKLARLLKRGGSEKDYREFRVLMGEYDKTILSVEHTERVRLIQMGRKEFGRTVRILAQH